MIAPQRIWQKISGSLSAAKAGDYSYYLGGAILVDRLRVELPQVNSLVQFQILNRAKTKDDWRMTLNAVAYRLRVRDTEVASPEFAVPINLARYWLLRVEQKGGVMGNGLPMLQVGWMAQKLVFAARGAGPFQLAYGSSAVTPAAFAIQSLIPGYRTDSEFTVKRATLGAPMTLAGAARLRAPWDYRQVALWSILIGGVGVLAWMALRLARQLAKPAGSGRRPDEM